MSNEHIILQGSNVSHAAESAGHHDDHGHDHHDQHFIWKYIFSQDHKIIGKQFLITGIIWAMIGALMSVFLSENSFKAKLFKNINNLLHHCIISADVAACFIFLA